MNETPFTELLLSDDLSRAVEDMGFENATEIQASALPFLREGRDVIGRSQTGTGKTVAFGIPAIEAVDTALRAVQVLVLCPTRELAVQGCGELQKLAKYKQGIRVVDVYGGAPMDRQILRLRTANIVVGTPGRVMDHIRRKTLRLENVKVVVLDEADEMLSMGFREDIETILTETPEERQTVLFSATMPPEILALTKRYQKEPKLIEINRKQVTVENIDQCYYDVPMGRKMDALNLILRYHDPKRCMIFCNTKRMVDDISEYLFKHGFSAEGLHGDLKQSQRDKVMEGFKRGRTAILVATDVAARGIDVSDIDYVVNYDIPQNTEPYIHRIGRTGRAGKSGKAITICSGRRQVEFLQRIGRLVRSVIRQEAVPTNAMIREKQQELGLSELEAAIREATELPYEAMTEELINRGYDLKTIASVALGLYFGAQASEVEEIKTYSRPEGGAFQKITINIGRKHRVAPNHIVGAITGQTDLRGKDIGKIEIFDDNTVVAVPQADAAAIVDQMKNCKICGTPTVTALYTDREGKRYGGKERYPGKDYRNLPKKRPAGRSRSPKRGY